MFQACEQWDYLIVTASNESQAAAYQSQLNLRKELRLINGVREVLVVPDLKGKRIGSGGSTVLCLLNVLSRELSARKEELADEHAWLETLRGLRILIMHAGGDSKRLPGYGPCGKIFVPVPGESDSAIGTTLFDRQLPIYLALPAPKESLGQIVITSGDVLVRFDPSEVRFASEGITGLGCYASPEQSSRHGVFCPGAGGKVRIFLQKPSPDEQIRCGAVNRYGQSLLDIGVMSLGADTAVNLLKACGVAGDPSGELMWTGLIGQAISESGLDFYREICCAMGTKVTFDHYSKSAKDSGSRWHTDHLKEMYEALSRESFHVQILPRCEFLDFGTSQQIIRSGERLLRQDYGVSRLDSCLSINNRIGKHGHMAGTGWVEGCSVNSSLTLEGENVVIGADIDEPIALPPRACLDVLPGLSPAGEQVWFVRCYGIDDHFKDTIDQGATFCGMSVLKWLEAARATAEDVWNNAGPVAVQTVWDARLFPVESVKDGFRRWLWMYNPSQATDREREAWKSAPRMALSDMVAMTDLDAFHRRRASFRAREIRQSLRRIFRSESHFSSLELAYVLAMIDDPAEFIAEILSEAHWHYGSASEGGAEAFAFSRILHTLGSAVEKMTGNPGIPLSRVVSGLGDRLPANEAAWLRNLGIFPDTNMAAGAWSNRLRSAAFENFSRTIISSGIEKPQPPKSILRSDEIVWGRAPARLDIGGGWTDTPPYSLENGGCVINAAVNLNGQPPIQAYARVIREPVVRISSIDVGERIEIAELRDLLDFRSAIGTFSLAKAALVISGLSPETASWPSDVTLRQMLERFGGGIELTTLAAIPKGSGLGTSSIIGAVILAVIQRIIGRTLTQKELFHGVLRLEQALTTGGGWQDQVGGAVDGVKLVTSGPGLVPEFQIHYVPSDVLDPRANSGVTLLYYTGITRLAKNILHQVVGRYLDRDRHALETLRRLHRLGPRVADAMARKDLAGFGRLIDVAWTLNKQLDPDSSNPAIEELLIRVRQNVYGAKLLGAGGGGFLLMVCKSPADAVAVRTVLEENPPNSRARFFDFDISREGLIVTVC